MILEGPGAFATVRRELGAAAADPEFAPIRHRLAAAGFDDAGLFALLTKVSHGPKGQTELLQLGARMRQSSDPRTLLERYVLVRTALSALDRIPALPVPDGVKALMLEELQWLTRPKGPEHRWLTAGTYEFAALCKLVTFRRFPAGQLHWEVSGLQRSSLWRVAWRDRPRLIRAIIRLGGFRPALTPHMAWRRRQIVLSEREHHRSLFLMARTLDLQPALLGFVAEAWFYSPHVARLSPHLGWAPKLFNEAGGVVLTSGPAGEDSGVYEHSPTRRRRAEERGLKPTLGLVIWPRASMLRWAASVDGS